MRQLTCFLLCIFAPYTFALEIFAKPATAAKYYLYSEGGQWHVDAVTVDVDQWPVIEKALTFHTETAARAYIQSQGVRPTAEAVANLGRELKSRSGSSLWTVTQQWNWDWEIKYAEWVKKELHTSWWKQYGIATDCADVAFTARWVFARINGLPMANSTLTGQWVTQNSVKTEWETLPTAPQWYHDQKFLAGLKYVMSVTFTHTLWADSYPIEINAKALIPGSHHLHLDGADSGHTLLIHSVGTRPSELPVEVLYSTVPADVRDLWSGVFLDTYADSNGSGFLKMRWPQWSGETVSLVAADQMPHYSTEQFDSNFIQYPRSEFWQEVFYRLNPNADFDKIALKTLRQLLDGFKARVQIVEQGYVACHATPCVEGTHEWEMWSTPTRDGRLFENVGVFDQLLGFVIDYASLRHILETEVVTIPGQVTLNLRMILANWRIGQYSSNPNDEIALRWGQ